MIFSFNDYNNRFCLHFMMIMNCAGEEHGSEYFSSRRSSEGSSIHQVMMSRAGRPAARRSTIWGRAPAVPSVFADHGPLCPGGAPRLDLSRTTLAAVGFVGNQFVGFRGSPADEPGGNHLDRGEMWYDPRDTAHMDTARPGRFWITSGGYH